MKFSEYCEGWYWFLLGGIFWIAAIPAALVLFILRAETQTEIIPAYIFMPILWFAAMKIFSVGVEGLRNNGKTALVLYDDSLDIIVHRKKRKDEMLNFKFEDIRGFYFVSNGTKFNKTTKQYEIKPNSSGTIYFALEDDSIDVYSASIYNALPAAEFIIANLDESQINKSRNELTKDGRHTPKD